MNLRIAAATFLVLLLGMLLYPPFYWYSSHKGNDTIIQDQLPVKKHACVFGPLTEKFQLKHFPKDTGTKEIEQPDQKEQLKNSSDEERERIAGIIPLQRSLALPDLAIEIVMGVAISALVGLFVPKKRKQTPDKAMEPTAGKAGCSD